MAQDYLNLTGTGNDAATASAWAGTPTPSTFPPKTDTPTTTGGGGYTTQGPNDGLAGALTGTTTGSATGGTGATTGRTWDQFIASLGYTGLGRDPFSGTVDTFVDDEGNTVRNMLDPNYWLQRQTSYNQQFQNRSGNMQNLAWALQSGRMPREIEAAQNSQQNALQNYTRKMARASGDPEAMARFQGHYDNNVARNQDRTQAISDIMPDLSGFAPLTRTDQGRGGGGIRPIDSGRIEQYNRFTDPTRVADTQSVITGLGQIADIFGTNPDLMNNDALARFIASMMGRTYGAS